MHKYIHEIRDPIHIFVRLDDQERQVLNSRPFQRLRYIHQLALTSFLYPAATHKRFEHSLGVMELAGRVFDIITHKDHISDEIKKSIPQVGDPNLCHYWRKVLRIAALCHDLGHLPFSHAAEKELLPKEWNHEILTKEIIFSDEMKSIWNSVTPPFRPEDIVKLAIGPKKAKCEFSDWESILSDIICSDAFGVDRMDYLLRDSYHIGVAYGKFDHYRLIDTLRILPPSPDGQGEPSTEPTLGVEEGGIHSAEALLLARYFMYTQVYLHPIRRIYDIHLKDFLTEWLPNHSFSTDINEHLKMIDDKINVAILAASSDEDLIGHIHAKRIVLHRHFKTIYEKNPSDQKNRIDAFDIICHAVEEKFDKNCIRTDNYTEKGNARDFPVRMKDDRIESSLALSSVLKNLPMISIGYIFADKSIADDVKEYIESERNSILGVQQPEGDEDHGTAQGSGGSD